ncbi:hypothetical protein Tco_0587488, partial [Tanacetum coccineum]
MWSGSRSFTLSTDFSRSDLVVSFPSRNRNKTFDLGISIEVQSKRFLSPNNFSISFISDPLSSVLKTLLPFSSEIEDKVFNPGILVSKEDKSPHLLSHRGFKAFKIIHNFLNESPMIDYIKGTFYFRISRFSSNEYSQKDKNKAKTDKTEHGIEKSVENRSRRRMHLIEPTRTQAKNSPVKEDKLNHKDSKIFSNPLFDSNADYTSSDDESSSEEDVPVENFKIYSNPLLEFDKEIFSSEINPLYNEVLEDLDSIPLGNENDHFNAESDLIESFL